MDCRPSRIHLELPLSPRCGLASVEGRPVVSFAARYGVLGEVARQGATKEKWSRATHLPLSFLSRRIPGPFVFEKYEKL